MRTSGFCGDLMGEVRLTEPELHADDVSGPTVLVFKGGRFALGYPLGMPLGVDASVSFQVYVDGALSETVVVPIALLSPAEGVQHHVEVIGIASHLAQMSQANVLNHVGGRRVRLTWSASSSDDVAIYHIYDNGGSGSVDYETLIAEVDALVGGMKLDELSWMSSELEDGTWRFGMRAVDAAGNVAENPTRETDEIAVTGLPLPPSDVAFEYEQSSAAVELTWTGSDSFN